MRKISEGKAGGISRRSVIKSAGAAVGVAAGSGAITGFPAVWSQEKKVLRYLGTAVNQSDDINKQLLKDTGITLEYISATTDDVTKRVITQPNSFDILDTEYFSLKKLVPSGNILGMDAKKLKAFFNRPDTFPRTCHQSTLFRNAPSFASVAAGRGLVSLDVARPSRVSRSQPRTPAHAASMSAPWHLMVSAQLQPARGQFDRHPAFATSKF